MGQNAPGEPAFHNTIKKKDNTLRLLGVLILWVGDRFPMQESFFG